MLKGYSKAGPLLGRPFSGLENGMSIAENWQLVNERVAEAAVKAGRDPSEVTIIAVTKTHPADTVEAALAAGVTDVGENRIQEFLSKEQGVTSPCRWHLIGHLQTNKVNKIIGKFAMIHSVDSLKLAEKLSDAGESEGVTTDILVEVNTSGEKSKFGLETETALELCEEIAKFPTLNLKGLMTVGPWVEDKAILSKAFGSLRLLGEKIKDAGIKGISMEHLSMGMTDDFEIAIAEGSTIVRLGRVIFGARQL
jgi:pyridoxal phosphate enzyme (YggS family)